MNIENYFEQEKGITVDAARAAGAKYTAIDMCKFAKNYHESEIENLQSSESDNEESKKYDWIKVDIEVWIQGMNLLPVNVYIVNTEPKVKRALIRTNQGLIWVDYDQLYKSEKECPSRSTL